MKRIIATSDGFGGAVHFVYKQDGVSVDELGQPVMVIDSVDYSGSDMDLKGRDWVLNYVPRVYSGPFPVTFGGGRMKFVEEGCETSFEMFWKRYNLKLNKIRVERLWKNMGAPDRERAYAGILDYHAHLNEQSWKQKANADTYLKNRMWENEWR